MKALLLFTALIFVFQLNAQTNKKNLLPFKSAIVEYVYEGNTTGTQNLYIDNNGWLQCETTQSVTKSFGQKTETNEVKLTRGMDIYQWVPGAHSGTKIHNSIAEGLMNDPNFNAEEFGKHTMEQLGFEKTGTESIIGKPCEIYSGMGTKIWIWKGIALKTDVKILGQKTTWIATSVKINESVPSSKFEIPSDVKFEDMGNLDPEEMMNKSMEQQDDEANKQPDSVKTNSEEEVPVKSLNELKGFLKKLKTE